MEDPAAAPHRADGALGPDADGESLVLDLLNRQDRYALRRTCQARRLELGARTATLVLSEEGEDAELVLSVDLARSFPAVRTLVLRCDYLAVAGWPERFAAFVARNLGALGQLQLIDVQGHCPVIDTTALAAIAQLTSLRSVAVSTTYGLDPGSWSALSSLAQLTSLRAVVTCAREDRHLQHIAAAAPRLQQLNYCSIDSTVLAPQSIASIASLASLASLAVTLPYQGGMQVLRSLTALAGLTHLYLYLRLPSLIRLLPEMVQALGKLTGLSSLEVEGFGYGSVALAPLAALQQLTSLRLECEVQRAEDAAVLASLGALRALRANLHTPAALAAAGLGRLQSVAVMLGCKYAQETWAAGDMGAPIQLAAGSCVGFSVEDASVRFFDTSRVHVLELRSLADMAAAREVLRSSPQLRALRLHGEAVLDPLVLQAVAACSSLSSMCLGTGYGGGPAAEEGLAALAQGCRQLRQLTLQGIRLSDHMVAVLMKGLPRLRLLRLLGCGQEVSQERCQALVGQLGLWELQVDVVVDDGSGRAQWRIRELAERWRGEVQ